MSQPAMRAPSASTLILRVVLPAMIAQNMAVSFIVGTYGPLLASTEQQFGISRAVATTGLSVFNLTVALSAPLIGGNLHRVPMRVSTVAAAVVSAFAYFGMAAAPSFALVLPMYALAGLGGAVLSILAPVTLISRSFTGNRGRMLAIINLPIGLLVAPNAVAALLPHLGRSGVLVAMGVSLLALIPILLAIHEPPPAATDGPGAHIGDAAPGAPLPAAAILRRPTFWCLSLAMGLTTGVGATFMVHVVPFGVTRGLTLAEASTALPVYALVGTGGLFLGGWIADRISGIAALAMSGAVQVALYLSLPHVPTDGIFVVAALMGICCIGTNALHGVSMNELVPVSSVARGMGLSYLIKLPFIFGVAPLASAIYDRHHSYLGVFWTLGGMMAAAAVLFTVALGMLRRTPA